MKNKGNHRLTGIKCQREFLASRENTNMATKVSAEIPACPQEQAIVIVIESGRPLLS